LRIKLVFASVAVEVILLGLLVYNSHRLIERNLIEQTQLRITELQPLLNAALAGPLAARDYATLSDILNASLRKEGLTYLVLLDHRGKVVAASGWDVQQPLPKLDRSISSSSDDSPERFDSETAITLAGQRYGVLHYGLVTDYLNNAKAVLLQQSLIIAVTEVVLSILLLSLLGLWLTRHLGQLAMASRQVAGGNLDITLPVHSDDEVGELTSAFNTMSASVRLQIGKLQQEQARLNHLLSAMNIGILFEDSQNRVIYSNPAFRRVWLIPKSVDLLGRTTKEVLQHLTNILSRPDHISKHVLQALGTQEASETVEIVLAQTVVCSHSSPTRCMMPMDVSSAVCGSMRM
jgi:HAMP domain-containing protein